MDPFLGEIRMTGFNFAPTGWALCNGQTLAISSNAALFSLLGTYYGGNGTTTFQLPNMQSRVPIHQGTGLGLPTYVIGQAAGTPNVSILTSNLPAHTHLVNVNTGNANQGSPSGGILAASNYEASKVTTSVNTYTTSAANATLAPTAIQSTGGNIPISIESPYLTVNFIIALQGIFPSRN